MSMHKKYIIDENNRTQIPIRAIGEMLGCDVDWNGDSQTVTITKDDKLIVIVIGKKEMQSGKEVIEMDTEAKIVNDRTYIPVRFVGEAFGMQVNYNGQ